MTRLVPFFILFAVSASCNPGKTTGSVIIGGTGIENHNSNNDESSLLQGEKIDIPESCKDAQDYMGMVDPLKDDGQFYFPEGKVSPEVYWTVPDIESSSDRNSLGVSTRTDGLQYHLLCQSLAGVVNKALEEGRTSVGIWLEKSGKGYDAEKERLGIEIGRQTAIELLTKGYGNFEGYDVDIRKYIEGYILTDVASNPESGIAAAMAAHVYNSVIVDVRDREFFDNAGFTMKYDARQKSSMEAWREFRNQCDNSALVIMPVQTGELREYCISKRLVLVNLNRRAGTSAGGQNDGLFDEVLAWLAPNAPVLGWEQGVSEDQFVDKVSRTGHLMLAADWSYNHSLTSLAYSQRQPATLAKVKNPRSYDYSKARHYVSFFLTDGDNYQWVMGDGFTNEFYDQPESFDARMSYGLCSQALCQLSPARFSQIYSTQGDANTLMETFGGGYFYVDDYAEATANRAGALKTIARKTASHMRQHRLKVLHLIAEDWDGNAAKEGYQAFIDANDQLEGIIVIQYSPYNGGHGNVLWFTNKAGYDIPVISVKYSLWSGGRDGQGAPAEIAALLGVSEQGPSQALIDVHAWSTFDGKRGAAAAADCIRRLPSTFEAVDVQELIWRIRMAGRKEQTLKYLSTIK